MHPVLLHLGGFSIYTYGFFIAIGFLAGIFLAKREAQRVGEDPEKILDLAFYILIAAIIGSRFFYVATNLDAYLKDPLEIFKIWNGGLVFFGGFIGALIAALIYFKKTKMKGWKTLDIITPSFAAGQFIGRIGCFFAGCCYGKVCDLPWAVTFTNPQSLAPLGIPLHPTQIYHSMSNLAIFCFLWLFRGHKKFEGQLFCLYLLLYGVTRSLLEILRGDFRGPVFFGMLSISQVIGCIMAIAGIFMMIFLRARSKKIK